MPKIETIAPGAPIWLDLASSDRDRATEFYSRVFGWESIGSGPEFDNYVTFTLHGERIAGLAGVQPGQSDAWLTYLATEDADATSAAIVESGGHVVVNHTIADLGSMVVALDTTGATVGAWQPGTHTGFGYLAEPGAPAWFELHAKDYAAAVPFYESAFGWSTDVLGNSDEFRMVTFGSPPFAGIYDASNNPDDPVSRWLPYLLVADTDAAVALIVELGGTQRSAVTDSPYGRQANVADPSGAAFAIIEPIA